jgi:geranylgeranyl diphosphate synthase, type I
MSVTPLVAADRVGGPSPTLDAAATPRAPADLDLIASRTEALLARLLTQERHRWAAVDPELDRPVAALVEAVLAGGKRLRPAFCHWGFVAAGGDPDTEPHASSLARASAAIELLHGFALVHDDVMDEAPTRRGRPTQHVRFASDHRQARWRGAPDRFGESVAILVGDLAHVLADDLVAGMPSRVRSTWRALQSELVMGQYLDVHSSAAGRVTVAGALEIARLKSGRYTVRRPLELGAALVEGVDDGPDDDALGAALAGFGEGLGLAFQLRDDVLGAFGDPGLTGKPVGADLREGKPTPLLAIALERAVDAQQAVLDRAGAPDVDDFEIARMQEVLIATGALDEVERTIDRLATESLRHLTEAVIVPAAVTALSDLAAFVTRRDH